MMRKTYFLVQIVILLMMLSACGGAADKEDPPSESYVSTTKTEESSTQGKDSGIIDDCKYTKENPLKIAIDPGHGGEDGGSEKSYSGTSVLEKDCNIRIAGTLKTELEKFDNVTVYMTHDGTENLSLPERVNRAKDAGCNVIISVHNNSWGEGFRYTDGSMVLAATGNYDKEIAEQDQELSAYILRELKGLGIADRGVLLRYIDNDEKYDNGNVADFYGIIRHSMRAGLNVIIIEHAYLDNEADYNNFLSTNEKLDELAKADARGIAAYYRLVPVSKETEDYKSQEIIMYGDDDEKTEYKPRTFKLNKLI